VELELTAPQTLTATDGNQQAFGFPEPLEILVRADSVNMLSMVAIPAEQTEISGESKFNDNRVPASASDAIALRLSRIVATRISGSIALNVINSQELMLKLATAHTLITVMGKNSNLVPLALIALPFTVIRYTLLPRSLQVWSGFDYTSSTQTLTTRLSSTLQAMTSSSTFISPRSTAFSCWHAEENNATLGRNTGVYPVSAGLTRTEEPKNDQVSA